MTYAGKPTRVDGLITGYTDIMKVNAPGYIPRGYEKLYSDVDTKHPKAVFQNDEWTVSEDAAAKALADGRGLERARLRTAVAGLKISNLNNVAGRNQAILDIAGALKDLI